MAMASVAPTTDTLAQTFTAHAGSSRMRQSKLFKSLVPRQHTSRPGVLQFIFTHRTIRRLWLLVLLVQLMNGLQLLTLSYVYLSYEPSSASLVGFLAASFLTSKQKAFLGSHSVVIGAIYAFLALIFMFLMMSMILGTFRNGQASFTLSNDSSNLKDGSQLSSASMAPKYRIGVLWAKLVTAALNSSAGVGAHRAWSRVRQLHGRLTSNLVAFGVRGKNFEEVMLIRETIELFFQAVQAAQVSQRISRPLVNYAYTALIALNAILHPMIGRVYQRDPQMKRFAMVFTDFFLDFVWGCLLPIWLYIPYLRLDRSKTALDLLMENGFGSIENAQREVEQIVVLSASALALSIFPFIGALVSLRSMKKLLQTARRIECWSELTEEERVASLEPFVRGSNQALHTDPERTSDLPVITSSRLLGYGHTLLSVFGATLSIIAIASSGVFLKEPRSNLRVWDDACKYPLTPWFATQPACAVWILDCKKLGLDGSGIDLVKAFGLIHKSSLVYLSIERCSSLEITPAVSQFRSIRAIAIWNSKLETWSDENPISEDNFPVLQTVVLENVTFTDEPWRLRGFTLGSWPANIEKAIFVATDITRLGVNDETAATWENVKGWYCVGCGITRFPMILFRSTALIELAIEHTALRSVPPASGWLELHSIEQAVWSHLRWFSLKHNYMLSDVASDVWATLTSGSPKQLWIQSTNISSIPSQVSSVQSGQLSVHAAGSPLCNSSIWSRRAPSINCEE